MGKGRVAIIGGGISGMVAGIFARRAGARVTIFDTNPTLGRKILKTGGGRCNFANEDVGIGHFHTDHKDYVKSIINKFDLEKILSFMDEIGVSPKSIEGWYYPNSLQARSVRDCLLYELSVLGCEAILETKVNGIRADGERFLLDINSKVLDFDGCILATGGMAAPESGSDGNGYVLSKGLGHEIITPLPALCPLMCDDRLLRKAAGIRTDATVSITTKGKTSKETGNLQITDYGISGICTMQLSFIASKALANRDEVSCNIDFLPDYKEADVKKLLKERYTNRGRGKSAHGALIGLLPDKLITCILHKAGIEPNVPAVNISGDGLILLSKAIKQYPINITDVRGFSQAQTTLGGVSFKDIDKNTLLSKRYKSLGFCGEILDVCGDCGGYNIMWAISSGAIVGSSIVGGL